MNKVGYLHIHLVSLTDKMFYVGMTFSPSLNPVILDFLIVKIPLSGIFLRMVDILQKKVMCFCFRTGLVWKVPGGRKSCGNLSVH